MRSVLIVFASILLVSCYAEDTDEDSALGNLYNRQLSAIRTSFVSPEGPEVRANKTDGEAAMKHLLNAQLKLKSTLDDMTNFIEGELQKNKDSPMSDTFRRKKRSTNSVMKNGHDDRRKRSIMRNGHEDRSMIHGHEDRKKRSIMKNGYEDRKKRSTMIHGHEVNDLNGHEDRKKRSLMIHGHEN